MFSSNYHILATISAVATATVAIIFLASSASDTDQSLRTSGSRRLQSASDPKTVTAKSTTTGSYYNNNRQEQPQCIGLSHFPANTINTTQVVASYTGGT